MKCVYDIWNTKKPVQGLSLFKQLLHSRGIIGEHSEPFLHPCFPEHAEDPHTLPGIAPALQRIHAAQKNKERVMICGDYDADGISGTALLMLALQHMDISVSYRLPDRVLDGYGLSTRMVESCKEAGVGLIITVDNGVSAIEAMEHAACVGIDVVITDHHLPPEKLPVATAIINPLLPKSVYANKHISGAGVALQLARALMPDMPLDLEKKLLQLAAIGITADVCSGSPENRAIVRAGCKAMTTAPLPGIKAILQNHEGPVTEETIGFVIGPRINAAGRIEKPETALMALLGNNNNTHASALERINTQRKHISADITKNALEKAAGTHSAFIMLKSSRWPRGVVGLAAGRAAEELHRVVILLEETKDLLIASCRCPFEEVNITDCLTQCSHLLLTFGGHSKAAGFSCKPEVYEELHANLQKIIDDKMKGVDTQKKLTIDANIEEADITDSLLDDIHTLRPFTEDNPEPVFSITTQLTHQETMGADSAHFRAKTPGGIKVVGFGFGALARTEKQRTYAVRLTRSFWRSSSHAELRIIDVKEN